MRRRFRWNPVLAAALLAFGGTSGIAGGWKTSPPAEQGMDAAVLAKMDAHARTALGW